MSTTGLVIIGAACVAVLVVGAIEEWRCYRAHRRTHQTANKFYMTRQEFEDDLMGREM